MSAILPLLFIITGCLSMALIWRALMANLPALTELRRRVAAPEYGSAIVVNLRDGFESDATGCMVRRPRHARHVAPKPITHRLHHFAKSRNAA